MRRAEQKLQKGGHDDMMMGLAIAHEARSQVSFVQEQINIYPHFNFKIEQQGGEDYGETIEIVQEET